QLRARVPGDAARHPRAREPLVDDDRLEQVRLRPEAAVLARDRARRVAMLDQGALPGQHLLAGRAAAVAEAGAGSGLSVGRQERADVRSKGFVLGAVLEVHGAIWAPASARDRLGL